MQLAEMLLVMQNTVLPKELADMRLKAFIRLRLGLWSDKLMSLQEKYSEFSDMEQLHKLRLKVKRFRYALQGVPEIYLPNSLLRSLKILQDMLGLLHDDYINDMLIGEIMQQYPEDAILQYEGAIFCGWERAKAEATLASLPELWPKGIWPVTRTSLSLHRRRSPSAARPIWSIRWIMFWYRSAERITAKTSAVTTRIS